jgi:hypothetical protein
LLPAEGVNLILAGTDFYRTEFLRLYRDIAVPPLDTGSLGIGTSPGS